MFAKIEANGDENASAVSKLKEAGRPQESWIGWNFEKFRPHGR